MVLSRESGVVFRLSKKYLVFFHHFSHWHLSVNWVFLKYLLFHRETLLRGEWKPFAVIDDDFVYKSICLKLLFKFVFLYLALFATPSCVDKLGQTKPPYCVCKTFLAPKIFLINEQLYLLSVLPFLPDKNLLSFFKRCQFERWEQVEL